MSKNKHKYSDAGKTSTQLQQEFNDVCFKLGQEIGNERRAITNQEVLKERQEELENAFYTAVTREKEAEEAKKAKELKKSAPAAVAQAEAALSDKSA